MRLVDHGSTRVDYFSGSGIYGHPARSTKTPAARASVIQAPPLWSRRFLEFMIALLFKNADQRRQPGGITVTTVLPGWRLCIGSRAYAIAAWANGITASTTGRNCPASS